LSAGAALVALAFWILWNLVPPELSTTVVTLTRGANGEFPAQGAAGFQAHAGQIRSQNNLLSSSASGSGDRARVACRSLVLACGSDHLLAQRAAAGVFQQLQKLPDLETITYLPPGERLAVGSRLPDLYLTLELNSLAESGLIDHVVDAQLVLRGGISAIDDNHTTINDLTPPVVEFTWQARLDHHSTTREVASSAARYKLVADDIASQLATAFVKFLADLKKQKGVLPELPPVFYPAFEPLPSLPLEGFEPSVVVSGHGLLRRNETVWKCRAARPLAEVLVDMHKRLTEAGYRGEPPGKDSRSIRLADGTSEVAVIGPGAQGQSDFGGPVAQGTTFHVKYQRARTADDRQRGVAQLFTDDAPLDLLLLFEDAWTTQQCATMLARLTSRPPATADLGLTVASLERRVGHDDAARNALRRAVALLCIEREPESLRPSIKALAKQLGDETIADQPADVALLRELGFVEVTAHGATPDVEFGPEGAANYFAAGESTPWIVSLQAVREGSNPGGPYALSFVRSESGMRSWTSGQAISETVPATSAVQHRELGEVRFSVIRLGEARFRASVEVRGR
jgi:hypothetical protein